MKYMYTIYLQIPVQKFTGKKGKVQICKKIGQHGPQKRSFFPSKPTYPRLKVWTKREMIPQRSVDSSPYT